MSIILVIVYRTLLTFVIFATLCFFKYEVVILLLRQIYALVISDWIGEKTCKHQSTENKDISKMNVAQFFGSLCTNSLKGINKH